MKLAGDHVEAKLKVRNDVALGQDSRATIKVTTILGSRYLSLAAGGPGALPDNTFDISARPRCPTTCRRRWPTSPPPSSRSDSDQFAETLRHSRQADARRCPRWCPQALANTHTLSTIIAERRDQLGSLLKTTELVSNTLRRQQSAIGQPGEPGQRSGRGVRRPGGRPSTRMMAALTNLVQTLSGIVIDDRPELENLLVNLRELSDMLGKHDDMLRSILQAAPVALRELTNATGTGNAVDLNAANGLLVDSWMCAISGRAEQFGMIEYYQDCK